MLLIYPSSALLTIIAHGTASSWDAARSLRRSSSIDSPSPSAAASTAHRLVFSRPFQVPSPRTTLPAFRSRLTTGLVMNELQTLPTPNNDSTKPLTATSSSSVYSSIVRPLLSYVRVVSAPSRGRTKSREISFLLNGTRENVE